MIKALVIGDTHFEDGPEGYLESQLSCLDSLISERSPGMVIFTGDIFHHRKPTPTCITSVVNYFYKWGSGREVIIIRGNHDSSSKSDDGNTILNLFSKLNANIYVATKFDFVARYNLHLIPHYENEDYIKDYLKSYRPTPGSLTIGHFGFDGCMAVSNDYTFTIKKELLRGPTILGHIHNFSDHGNVKIIGTPYGTNFGEADRQHYYAEIYFYPDLNSWGNLVINTMEKGPRYMVLPYESLEVYKEELLLPGRYTLLRVLLNRFAEDSIPSLKSELMQKFKVNYVDFKFQPIYDKKLSSRLSDYDPQSALDSIDSNIIDKYLDEQKSSIPTEELKKGLDLINNYANTENQA